MAPLLPHFVSAALALLVGYGRAQDIPIAASSLDQVASDTFLDAICLSNANPGISGLSVGDTFIVPLDCCGTQSFTCGGPFCIEIPACAATSTGIGTITVTTAPSTLTASVTGTMTAGSGTGATTTPVDGGSDTGTTTTLSGDNTTPAATQTSDAGSVTSTISSSTTTDSNGAVVVIPIVTVVPNPNPGTSPDPTPDPNTTADPTTALGPTTDPADAGTTRQTTTDQTTTSSTTSSGTPQPTAFLISTKRETTRSDFDAFIKTLPDEGKGNVIAYDNIPWQSYVTKNLTAEQANEIKNNPIVDIIGPITEEAGEAGVIAASRRQPRISKREDSPRAGSPYHLGMLSAPRDLKDTETWPDYEFDSALGKDQTIYVIDTGYRKTHEEFALNGRTVDEYVVPNAFTLGVSPFVGENDQLAPEDMTDWNGHGSAVLTVAGGVTKGVASGANLVVVKFRNAAANSVIGRMQIRQVTGAALRDAWDYSINDIIRRRNEGQTGKFVINMSYGFRREGPLPLLTEQIMDRIIPFAQEKDIVVVVAAGNEAPDAVDQFSPQNLGTADNSLITVGALEKDGSLFKDTTPDRGMGGALTVYAAGRAIEVATPESDTSTGTADGTSIAAPAVAGMAAYFFSLSELDENWPAGSVARAMEQFFVLSARVQRNSNPVPPGLNYQGPPAGSVVCAWNRHPVGFGSCAAGASKMKRQDGSPDLSCDGPSQTTTDSQPTTTPPTTTADTLTTTEDPTTTDPPTTVETPTTTDAPTTMTTSKPCTVFYGTTSSCVQTANDCPFGNSVVCPLAKRALHAATATTYHLTSTFTTAVQTTA